MFTLFKYKEYKKDVLYSIIQKLAKYSFGAYLVHVLIIKQLNLIFGLNTLSFNPALSVVVIGIIVFVISFLISAILNNLFLLKNYIV